MSISESNYYRSATILQDLQLLLVQNFLLVLVLPTKGLQYSANNKFPRGFI